MAPAAGRLHGFHREGSDWFCNAALPSDVTVTVEGISFHLHKFPLISKCGKIALSAKESLNIDREDFTLNLEDFPGGPDSFLLVAKFCYGVQVELTPRNVVTVYCAAHYLEMTDEYGEGNLLSKCESYFHKNILRNWKDCIVALQNSELVFPLAESLQLVRKCMNAVSMMVCTDPSLFGWPMKMYGSLQSPGGSILWNGINTGARIRSSESDWWFEDVSYLSVRLFEMLIKTMEKRGVRPENLAAALFYYARKYLPGLGRWQSGKTRTVASFSLTPVTINQRVLLESIVRLLPDRKGKSFCRFLLGLLRVASILNADRACKDALEKKIGQQLDLATLDSLLLPSYSDSDTLYDTDCIERIVTYYASLESKVSSFSPSSFDLETSPTSGPLVRVAKLIDAYLAEVASDVNLKPQKIRALAEALPDSSRPLHDGLYRAVDVYFKGHPWLSDKEKEDLCTIIDYQKLSIDACAHASQNERLPLRVVLQVLFFEQIQLRKAFAGCLHAFDTEDGAEAPVTIPSTITGQIVQRDGWVSVVRENQVLKVNMENMRSRVGELEEEFSRIKQDMRRISKSCSSMATPRISLSAWKIGCRLIPQPSDRKPHPDEGSGQTSRMSVEEARPSMHSRHRKSLSLVLNSHGTSASRKRG